MTDKTLLVIGAAGDVGQGVVRAARDRGWRVVASGRHADKLAASFASNQDEALHLCAGDVGSEEGALALWNAASGLTGGIDAVVVAVNAPNKTAPLSQWTSAELSDLLAANLLTHFHVAKTMLPLLPDDGVLVGIGGGTADFVIPGMAYLSMAQAGLRMMYRGFAKERTTGAQVRELMIVSMVNGASKRDTARPEWVTDDEVGEHVCAIVAAPEQFPGPILQLKSREQVGKPDPASLKG